MYTPAFKMICYCLIFWIRDLRHFALSPQIQTLQDYQPNNCLYSKNMSKPIRNITIISEQEQVLIFSPPKKEIAIVGQSQPDSEDDKLRSITSGHSKVVQFEQFVPEEDKQGFSKNAISPARFEKHGRNFLITVPSDNYQNQQQNVQVQNAAPQQPPAPKNKKVLKQRTFVFPSIQQPAKSNKKQARVGLQDTTKQKRNNEQKQLREGMKKWQLQRQELTLQNQRLEKQILVKNGQLQILQKVLSSFVGSEIKPEEIISKITNSYYQKLLDEKQTQVNALLSKITELDQELTRRAEELATIKDQCNRLTYNNQHLTNQLYIAQSIKKTAETYLDTYQNHRQSAPLDESINSRKGRIKQDRAYYNENERNDNLQMIYRRLDRLTHCRKQLQQKEQSSSFNRTFLREGNRRSVKERLAEYTLKASFC